MILEKTNEQTKQFLFDNDVLVFGDTDHLIIGIQDISSIVQEAHGPRRSPDITMNNVF